MLNSIRGFLLRRAPFLAKIWRAVKYSPAMRGRTPERIFTAMYRAGTWGARDSRSGSGASLEQTRAVRDALPGLVRELGCRSLLDIPCGDFFWMRTVELDLDYTGADIVAEMIERNAAVYPGAKRRFVRLDLTRDELPRVDLVLCRDCLGHLPYAAIFEALGNVKRSLSAYLLTTTFADRRANEDVPTGAWRPINLRLAPFRLPAPIKLISEEHPDASYRDKSLGLWRVADIPDYG